MRRLRVACTAACASGVSTPSTGTLSADCSWGSAADVAVLHATTMSLTSWVSRNAPISRANVRTSASGRGPYGSLAWSPR